MKDTIYTIPVSEVFEPMDGCPICRLRDTLETRCVEYIMGAAMMEPDIRIETNKAGFCHHHFTMMMGMRNRLSIALMLESHLDSVIKEVFDQKPQAFKGDKRAEQAAKLGGSCYVCDKIDWAISRMLDTLFSVWEKEPAFRDLYDKQPVICLEHFSLLGTKAKEKLNKKQYPLFMEATARITANYLRQLKTDVSGFCKLYDYRSAGAGEPSQEIKTSIERAIWFLTSREVPEREAT